MAKTPIDNRHTLLVVEDDPGIRDLMCECLREEGYRVAAAADAEEAVDALARLRFDLVLADALGAPPADPQAGQWPALARILTASGGIPVVICTAHQASGFADFRERGFSDLLLKPFDLDELLATVRRNLGGAR